ncbi:hypothetical protein [Deinococcus depolymerans]|uniref:Uncharacterized protein n=1 Tax=Deinococcus depolymerans TaxID=392408 RepID=A0ABP3LQP8_9DEIO
MSLLTLLGFLLLLQVITGLSLGVWFAYLALRGPRHSLNADRQLRYYQRPADHGQATGAPAQASD